jgi:hypothetical protein
LTIAKAATTAQLEKLVRGYRRVRARQDVQRAEQLHQRRYLHTYVDDDGTVVIKGRLDAETGAAVIKALDLAQQGLRSRAPAGAQPGAKGDAGAGADGGAEAGADCSGEAGGDGGAEAGAASDRTSGPGSVAPSGAANVSAETSDSAAGLPIRWEQLRADALGLVAQSALDHQMQRGSAADRTQVVVHVDAAVLHDGQADGQSCIEQSIAVSAETSRRLCCDAAVVRISEDAQHVAGSILNVGRKTRTIPPALRRALNSRDRMCRFPGFM